MAGSSGRNDAFDEEPASADGSGKIKQCTPFSSEPPAAWAGGRALFKRERRQFQRQGNM